MQTIRNNKKLFNRIWYIYIRIILISKLKLEKQLWNAGKIEATEF
jgi:hypothetical protein